MSSLAKTPKKVDQDKPADKVTQSLAAENELLMEEIAKKDESLKLLKKENQQLSAKLKEQDAYISQQRSSPPNSPTNSLNAELKKSVKEMETSIEKLKTENREYQETLKEEWATQKKLQMESMQLRGEIGITNEKNTSLNERLKDLKDEIEYLRNQSNKERGQAQPISPQDNILGSEDVLLIGDSHLKRINADWLLKKENKKTKIEISYKLEDTRRTLTSLNSKHQCIVIHCGTNDLKERSPESMMATLLECIDIAKAKAGKVVVGSLIPRYDDPQLNLKTQIFNTSLLENSLDVNAPFLLADNSNLHVREDLVSKYFVDDKLHLNQDGSSTLAANMRRSICNALQIKTDRERSPSPSSRNPQNRRKPYYQNKKNRYYDKY